MATASLLLMLQQPLRTQLCCSASQLLLEGVALVVDLTGLLMAVEEARSCNLRRPVWIT
jgi:hypothetical protein